jgi:predicted permease
MSLWRQVCSGLRGLIDQSGRDGEIDEEVREYFEAATAAYRERGLSEEEARRAARRECGNPLAAKEQVRTYGWENVARTVIGDLRFAGRQLRRSPGFALTAIVTLALGLGANTAVFSLIDALLLRPLSVPHSDELAVLRYERTDDADRNYSFCAPMLRALERRHDAFEALGGFSSRMLQVRGASGNVRIRGAMVSGQFFEALRVRPLVGRALTPQDDQKGGGSGGFAVVISEGFWHSWFNRAPDVLGRQVTIANVPFTVVGVMPRSFIGADPTQPEAIYAPLWAEPVIDAPYDSIAAGHHSWWMRVIARRRTGTTLEHANAALAAASGAIVDETAAGDGEWIKRAHDHHFKIVADPGSTGYSRLRERFSRPLIVVFSLCGAMLLLACFNLASLLMARAAGRERELATRLAMGATRRRLVGQLMAESALIALLGTAAGLMAAPAVSHALAAVIVGSSPYTSLDAMPDARIFAFVALAAAVSCLLIGLIPAVRATAKNLNEQIKSGTHRSAASERRGMLPRLLMSLEVALALMLVVGAGLLATSLVRLYDAGLGFDAKGVVNLNLDMGKQGLDGEALVGWYREYGEALGHQPGVTEVSFAAQTPMDGNVWTSTYRTSLGGDRDLYMNRVAPRYLGAMRIPLLAGRDFAWNDTLSSGKKIILSEKAATALFPGLNPVGRRVDHDKESIEVIGVAGDITYNTIREGKPVEGYVPITQNGDPKPSYTAVVRVEGSVDALAAASRHLAASMAPDIPAPVLTTMNTQLDESISSERMMAMLAVFFAVCALVVTAIGLYGTLAYATARRTSEIGVRMALGARRMQVMALVFGENAWIAASGSAIGLMVALMGSRVLASFLYGLSARDPWVIVGSVAMLAAVSSAASMVPALRAAWMDPMEALRAE